MALLSMGFSGQGCWSGLPGLLAEGLPDPGIEHESPATPALQANSLPLRHWGSPVERVWISFNPKAVLIKGGASSHLCFGEISLAAVWRLAGGVRLGGC